MNEYFWLVFAVVEVVLLVVAWVLEKKQPKGGELSIVNIPTHAPPADVPAPAVTLGQELDAKLAAARAKVDGMKAAVHDDISKAEDDVKKLEAESAAMPAHMRDMAHDEVVAHVHEWFKG